MAWWKTGHGDDVMGDMPADTLGKAVDSLLDSAGSLKLADVLAAVESALNSEPRALLDETRASAYRVVAVSAAGTVPAAASERPVRQRAIVLDALREVALDYHDAVNRAPRATELAYALEFVLKPMAKDGRFGEGPQDVKQIKIEPRTSQAGSA